jgi:predicted sugar kinase
VKESLGRVRGKYGGAIKVPDSELKLDYESLISEGKDEKTKLEEELKLRLERLRPEKQMEKEALIAENLNKQLKFNAFPRQIYVI